MEVMNIADRLMEWFTWFSMLALVGWELRGEDRTLRARFFRGCVKIGFYGALAILWVLLCVLFHPAFRH